MIHGLVVRPLTDLTEDSRKFLADLKESADPIFLTVDGEAEFVVQDIAAYRKLRDSLERFEHQEAIREALAEAERGEGRPMDEFFDELEAAFENLAES